MNACYPLLLKAALSEQFCFGRTPHLLHTAAARQPDLQGALTLNMHLQTERDRNITPQTALFSQLKYRHFTASH